jgi:hypothetical protein
VTFDPFGDFATEGYLRNFEKPVGRNSETYCAADTRMAD